MEDKEIIFDIQMELENAILELFEKKEDFTFSDLQGAIQAQIMIFTNKLLK